MQSVTRGSRRMLPQKPASSLVTSQKHSPSYSYHAGFTFGQPSSPTVPTLTKILVSVRNSCSSSGVIPRPFPSRNPLDMKPLSAQHGDRVDLHQQVRQAEIRHLHERTDRKPPGLEEPLAHADLGGRVADVLQEDRDLDDVGERAAGSLDGEADVPPHLLGLAARVADADDLVLLVEGDLACEVKRVAAADRVGVGFGRGR